MLFYDDANFKNVQIWLIAVNIVPRPKKYASVAEERYDANSFSYPLR